MSNFDNFLNEMLKKAEIEDQFQNNNIDMVLAMLEEFELNDIEQCFKVGDYVTPKKGMNLKGRGMPHKVIAVYDNPLLQIEHISSALGCYNMLITCYINSSIKLYAAMSTDYEPWIREVAES